MKIAPLKPESGRERDIEQRGIVKGLRMAATLALKRAAMCTEMSDRAFAKDRQLVAECRRSDAETLTILAAELRGQARALTKGTKL